MLEEPLGSVLVSAVPDDRVTVDAPTVAVWPVVTEMESPVPEPDLVETETPLCTEPVIGLETEVETCTPPEVWTELEAPTGPVSEVEAETEACALPPCSDAPTWVDPIPGACTLVETPRPEWELPLPVDAPTPPPPGRGTLPETGGSAGALMGGSPAAAAWPAQRSSAASAPAPADPASATPRPALLVRAAA